VLLSGSTFLILPLTTSSASRPPAQINRPTNAQDIVRSMTISSGYPLAPLLLPARCRELVGASNSSGYQPLGGGAAAMGLAGPAQAQDQTDTVGNPATLPVRVTPELTERTLPSAMPTWRAGPKECAVASSKPGVVGAAPKAGSGKLAGLVRLARY